MRLEATTSVKVTQEQADFKERTGTKWSYLIQKGINHMKECVPRQEDTEKNYNILRKSKLNLQMVYLLQKKYPKIYDELLMETTAVIG